MNVSNKHQNYTKPQFIMRVHVGSSTRMTLSILDCYFRWISTSRLGMWNPITDQNQRNMKRWVYVCAKSKSYNSCKYLLVDIGLVQILIFCFKSGHGCWCYKSDRAKHISGKLQQLYPSLSACRTALRKWCMNMIEVTSLIHDCRRFVALVTA